MDVILEALKKSGQSTARELAESQGLEARDVLSIFLLLEQKARVSNLNGYWYVLDAPVVHPAPRARKDVSDKLVALVIQHAPITSTELAILTNISRERVSSYLSNAYSEGRVGRLSARRPGGSCVYTAPASIFCRNIQKFQMS